MASPQLEEILQQLRNRPTTDSTNIDDSRALSDARKDLFPLSPDVKVNRVSAGGVPAEWIAYEGNPPNAALLYLHGGGYVQGSMRSHRSTISWIGKAAGICALGLEYRLAPESQFPAAVEDSVAAYSWLLSTGHLPSKMAIAGDSAGGGLTLSTLIALRYYGLPMPAAGVCISPWTDLTQSGDSMKTNAESDPTVGKERLDDMAGLYYGSANPEAPLASPLFADLTGLPPLLVQVGSIETLLDDSTRLVEKAKASGVDATLEVWDDMPHVWHNWAPVLPEAQQAVDSIGEFLRQRMNGG